MRTTIAGLLATGLALSMGILAAPTVSASVESASIEAQSRSTLQAELLAATKKTRAAAKQAVTHKYVTVNNLYDDVYETSVSTSSWVNDKKGGSAYQKSEVRKNVYAAYAGSRYSQEPRLFLSMTSYLAPILPNLTGYYKEQSDIAAKGVRFLRQKKYNPSNSFVYADIYDRGIFWPNEQGGETPFSQYALWPDWFIEDTRETIDFFYEDFLLVIQQGEDFASEERANGTTRYTFTFRGFNITADVDSRGYLTSRIFDLLDGDTETLTIQLGDNLPSPKSFGKVLHLPKFYSMMEQVVVIPATQSEVNFGLDQGLQYLSRGGDYEAFVKKSPKTLKEYYESYWPTATYTLLKNSSTCLHIAPATKAIITPHRGEGGERHYYTHRMGRGRC